MDPNLPGFGVPPAGAAAPSIFDEPAAAPIASLDPALLAGPVPAANPFDLSIDPAAPPAAAAAAPDSVAASPFDPSLFGPNPGANPFGGGDPFAPIEELGGLGAPTGAFAADPGMSGAPAAMSEEEYVKTQISDAIMPVFQELVTELRRSLDFYRNRANGLGAQQVVITGGTAKVPGLAEYLAANLEVPVVVGNPLQFLSTGPKADPNYLQDVGPHFPVSVGLAIRELLSDPAPARRKK
jgi:hypothetical protein